MGQMEHEIEFGLGFVVKIYDEMKSMIDGGMSGDQVAAKTC